MHNTIDPPVPLDSFHTLDLRLALGRSSIVSGLRFEKRNAESTRLEDAHDVLHDVGSLAASLAGGDVGFERGVGALGLGCDVHGEVVRGV